MADVDMQVFTFVSSSDLMTVTLSLIRFSSFKDVSVVLENCAFKHINLSRSVQISS